MLNINRQLDPASLGRVKGDLAKVLEITGISYCFHFDELICIYPHIEFHLNTWKFKMPKMGKILHSTYF